RGVGAGCAQRAHLIVALDQQPEAVQAEDDGSKAVLETQCFDALGDENGVEAELHEALAGSVAHCPLGVDPRARSGNLCQWRQQAARAACQLEHWSTEASRKRHVNGDVGEVAIVLPVIQPREPVKWIDGPRHLRNGSSTEPRVPNRMPSSRNMYRPT